ncbi:hypothetical protein FRC11_001219 [Ceratobasidium sp. 423]|nr:hypothetical protein FRC11_001219 [Ceratobasidium sp. 423]
MTKKKIGATAPKRANANKPATNKQATSEAVVEEPTTASKGKGKAVDPPSEDEAHLRVKMTKDTFLTMFQMAKAGIDAEDLARKKGDRMVEEMKQKMGLNADNRSDGEESDTD